MSIVTKVLVVFAVVLAIGVSVMVSVYAYVQPNYKEAYDRAREQAEAASAVNLNSSSDRFVTQPQLQMEVALRDAEIRELRKAVDEKDREIKTTKDSLTLAITQYTALSDPLAQLKKELEASQKLLSDSQKELNRVSVQTATLVAQLSASEKTAVTNDARAKVAEATVKNLKLQNKAQDDQIRKLEIQGAALEREREGMAVAIQQLRFSSSDTVVRGPGVPGGNPSAPVSILQGSGGSDLAGLVSSTGRERGILRLNESPRIRGKVIEVKTKDGIQYATLNVGEDDKLSITQTLHMFKMNPAQYLGTITLTRVDYQSAAGRIDAVKGAVIDLNDKDIEVTNDLRNLR